LLIYLLNIFYLSNLFFLDIPDRTLNLKEKLVLNTATTHEKLNTHR